MNGPGVSHERSLGQGLFIQNFLQIHSLLWFAWTPYMCVCMLSRFSRVHLFAIPWTVACQAPLSMRFSRQVGCCALYQGIFPTQGLNPHLLCLPRWQEGSLPLAPPGESPPPINEFLRNTFISPLLNQKFTYSKGLVKGCYNWDFPLPNKMGVTVLGFEDRFIHEWFCLNAKKQEQEGC